jgi:G3E family GTPase
MTGIVETSDARPWIVVVGGFLGAGKTTLLLAAARELEQRGLRSAVVMNDQGVEKWPEDASAVDFQSWSM